MLAFAVPAVAVAVWGLFAAPRAQRRLPVAGRVPLELSIFALSATGLWVAGHPALATGFGLLVAVNAIGLTAFKQWES